MASKKKKTATDEQRQIFLSNAQGMIEAGFLMAAADGNLADNELNVLAVTLSELFQGAISSEQICEILGAHRADLERDGFASRMQAVAQALSTDEARKAALQVAFGVMIVDGDIDKDDEFSLYLDLADALGIDRATAKAIGDEAIARLEGDEEDEDALEHRSERSERDGGSRSLALRGVTPGRGETN